MTVVKIVYVIISMDICMYVCSVLMMMPNDQQYSEQCARSICMCKGSLCSFVLPFLFFFSSLSLLLCLSLPVHFYSTLLCSRQNGLGAAQIYTQTQERKSKEYNQSSLIFFSILFFRVTAHSYVHICIHI